ncbi:pectinesterase family protein [Paenibacillus methanolicus]|uniref:Pectinesterase n=1 Tax=Paenibacillus methanolicus TaxID=582686 RepID=A0A5S5CIQ8_9BACL|nr:pectinesterase family protein [Paenibacillus methanolicus]TYP78240.1 pectinesterase [Paenibacillus methanolicus]
MLVGPYPGCDYATIQAAVDELERRTPAVTDTLTILPGVYEENVRVYRSDLRIVGIGKVVIRGRLSARQPDKRGEPLGTFGTATLFLGGSRIEMENVTVENAAGCGDLVGQAVALYAHCDEAVFRNCAFLGCQDTLCTGPLPETSAEGKPFGGIPIRERHSRCRQLYIGCRIEGTVDFIFGGATALFERCQLHARKRLGGGPVYVTAASTPAGGEHGYVFRDCLLTAEEGAAQIYLGRPWREAAKTDYVGCLYGAPLHPDRWDDWEKPHARVAARYREFGCRSLLDASSGRSDEGTDGRLDERTANAGPPDRHRLPSAAAVPERLANAPHGNDDFGLRSDRIPAGLEAADLFRDSAFLNKNREG